jgi:hypothetical protein
MTSAQLEELRRQAEQEAIANAETQKAASGEHDPLTGERVAVS